ncbi:MAG: acylphosphatase [Candidatus Atribacteria bacterium]|nr:acylphosphatase [Candidatus Atribacteria bacterium]
MAGFRGLVSGIMSSMPHRTTRSLVEVVAEGQKEEVRNFFLDIQEGPVSASIRSVVEEWSPYTGFYPTFQVEYE